MHENSMGRDKKWEALEEMKSSRASNADWWVTLGQQGCSAGKDAGSTILDTWVQNPDLTSK